MNPLDIIKKYYEPGSKLYKVLVSHSEKVTEKALEIAGRNPGLHADLQFIREACMLHDIGIFRTHAPGIGCHGKEPYIRHGVIGKCLLDCEGLPRHGLVCERHTGVGITAHEIEEKNLPLPKRDLVPVTIEEQLICFADKFYSKEPGKLGKQKTVQKIKAELQKHGIGKVKKFEIWLEQFGE